MKLTNIVLAALTAMLVLNSCKKDDVNVPGDGGVQGDARLNISLKVSGEATKAVDPEQQEGEAVVNNVTVIVFNETGTQLLATPFRENVSTTDETISILNIPVQSTIARIVIVANTPENAFANLTSYADMQSRLAQLADQAVANLTMSSQVIVSKTALLAGDNYLGYTSQGTENINGISEPLELTRLVARVDLKNVKTSFTGADLQGKSVRIDGISLRNVKTASHFFSEDYWGVVMADGNLFAGDFPVPVADNKKRISNGNPQTDICRVYVMENQPANPDDLTTLVIKATLVDDASGLDFGGQKEFTSVINLNGVVAEGDAHKYVKRNYVYRLNVNFTDNSFSDQVGSMVVSVEVVAWGGVNHQHPVID